MATDYPRTTAHIAGHPIHPMLVPFPIVLFVATLVADIAYWRSGGETWVMASQWLLAGGLGFAVLAAVAGIVEFAGDRRVRRLDDAWWHAGTNVVVVVAEAANLVLRLERGPEFVLPAGLAISAAATGLLLFSGWKGGALVYRYRVGIRHNDEKL
jgi:uncharacterized membrane protein